MVVAAGLEPLAVPISLRAEGNQVLADGQADLTGKQTGRGPRAESERAKQERLRRGSAAHLRATCEAKKMMMRSRLGEPLLRRDADTSEAKADAASKMALLKTLVCWGAVAATGEGKASRAHAPAVQATVRWRHRGPM